MLLDGAEAGSLSQRACSDPLLVPYDVLTHAEYDKEKWK